MVVKRPAVLITNFFVKRGRKGNLYFLYTFNKVHLVITSKIFASSKVLPPQSINPTYALAFS